MASSNTALRVTELDFDSIKENLKEFLRDRSGFTDFNFEGSNWSLLLDTLAYNTHYMGYYVNAVANEMFLDTAQLRDSVLSHAKLTNYVPRSKRAATGYVTIEVTPGTGESSTQRSLTLDKYTRLVSTSDDGKALIFVTNESDSVEKANGKFTFANVEIKQGDVVSTQRLMHIGTNPQRRFNLPTANCDTNTLSVIVQQSRSNTMTEVYTLAEDITEVTANTPVYYIEENPESNGSFCVVFGDNYLGKQPANGSVIIMTYVDTLGPAGNDCDTFTLLDDINGYSSNIAITTIASSAAGSNKETIEQIRFRAPLAATAQNRAVTTKDYEILLPRDYPNIQAVSVWGGQDADPPVYGKVYISLLPRDGYNITAEEKERIVEEIISTRAMVTVTPEIVDPEILYLVLKLTVRYDPKMTSLRPNQLKNLIRSAIYDYNDSELVDFNDEFRTSTVLRAIDNVDPSIKGSDLELFVQKRVEVVANTSANYVVDFGVPLRAGGVFDRIETKPLVVLEDTEGVSRECRIEENANTLTGITSITVRSGGNSYKRNPTVVISGDGVGAEATANIVNGIVNSITVTKPGTGYTQASVSIRGGGGSGALATARLQADRATLYSYYFGTAGRKVVVDATVGTIRYDQGKIYLNNFSPIAVNESDNYPENTIVFNAYPASNIVKSTRNQIVQIDEDDSSAIQITLIAEE